MNNAGPTVLVIDAERQTFELLREWLTESGWRVADESTGGAWAPFQLVLVDVAFPRRDGAATLHRITAEHAGTPVLMLSAMFHASVEACGDLARSLGVACVLPKPVRREALTAVVRRVSNPPLP
ncbi:response regulator [Variovorax sp. J22R133]|uniref:response regulator n=1 Tax=Variovorax brevis TaxID=3053503 RepID=UPI0025767B02|nr:response regulator [Variovorax sp. J22R133]MDM0113995.1 response regulator [Variovorax sp. J22R133]